MNNIELTAGLGSRRSRSFAFLRFLTKTRVLEIRLQASALGGSMMRDLGTAESTRVKSEKRKRFVRNRALPALILGGFIAGSPTLSPSTSTFAPVPFDRVDVSKQSNEELAFLRNCEATAEDVKRVRDAENRDALQENLGENTDYKYGYSALTAAATMIHPVLGIVYGAFSLTQLTRMEQEAAAFNEGRIRASDETLIHEYELCEIRAW